MSDEIIIEEKELKGEDGHRTFSLRIKESNFEKLNELASKTNQSRNALINAFIEYGLNHYKIKSKDE